MRSVFFAICLYVVTVAITFSGSPDVVPGFVGGPGHWKVVSMERAEEAMAVEPTFTQSNHGKGRKANIEKQKEKRTALSPTAEAALSSSSSAAGGGGETISMPRNHDPQNVSSLPTAWGDSKQKVWSGRSKSTPEVEPVSLQDTGIRGTVAYAITVTKDGRYIDGAAVLGEAVGHVHKQSRWNYALVAIVHVSVSKSIPPLRALGWHIVRRDLPFSLDAIENQEYAEAVKSNGCCGHLELLKLHAWSLTRYAWVVHLDMDSFPINKPSEWAADLLCYKISNFDILIW